MDKKKLYLTLGIVTVGLLVGGLAMLFRAKSHSTSSYAVSQINLPTVQYPTVPPSAPAFTISILSVGDSGITGTATFEDVSGAVAILLHVNGLPEDDESPIPVELHYGACTEIGPLAYPLSSPDAGESETDLLINLKQFNTQKPMAVILYRSTQDRTMIACGDVP